MTRTFSGKQGQTIRQIDAKGFEKIGDKYEGTFQGTKIAKVSDPKKAEGFREGTIIRLKPDTGDEFGVWSNVVLDEMIQQVEVGTYIRIRHTGLGKKSAGKQGAKLFEIDIADAA
jgi:hypothetical protein